jgi:hypothetical protein
VKAVSALTAAFRLVQLDACGQDPAPACLRRVGPSIHQVYTANEGPIYVWNCAALLFPKQNYNVLYPNSFAKISIWEIYIFPGSVCLFCCSQICGPILEIFKSLTDTWMWKMGLRPGNSQKRNTWTGFSLQCRQRVFNYGYQSMYCSRRHITPATDGVSFTIRFLSTNVFVSRTWAT